MKTSKLLSFMALLVLIVSLSACGNAGGTNNENQEVKLRIAYFPNITHAQALVMKDQGKLEETLGDNVTVTWTAFNAGPAEIESMFAGAIDLGYIGPIPAINAYDKSGGDISIIANASNGGAVLVTRKDLVLNDVKELSGKKVAIPQLGNTQHLSLLNILSENDLKPTSDGGTVEVVAVQNSDVKQLMDDGELDAALVPEPWGSILEKEIEANLLLDYRDVWMDGDYSVAVVISNNDFKTAHPDIVKQFLQVHKETTLFINENPEEAKTIVNRQIEEVNGKPIDTAILDKAFSRLKITEQINKDSIFDFAEINKQAGFISKLPDEGIIDASFLE